MPGSSLDWVCRREDGRRHRRGLGHRSGNGEGRPGCVRTPMLQRGPGELATTACTSCHSLDACRRRHARRRWSLGSHNQALGLRTVESVNRLGTARTRLAALAESRGRPSGYLAIWVATALLFAVSPLLATGSVSSTALLAMLPFAAILAIASIGQTLVIQQRGLDLSVPGMITLTDDPRHEVSERRRATSCRRRSGSSCSRASAPGTISGLAVTRFGITPLVATLGVDALPPGAVLQITSGTRPVVDARGAGQLRAREDGRHPQHGDVAVGVAAPRHVRDARTTCSGDGSSPSAPARPPRYAAGIRVARLPARHVHRRGALLRRRRASCSPASCGRRASTTGNDYLLPTIAAVVLGGTSLAGGRAA